MTVVGIQGGLSIDHLVTEPIGVRFAQLGGPGLFAALGARLVAGVEVRLATGLPAEDGRFAELFDRMDICRRHCAEIADVPRLWILNSRAGRRIVGLAPGDTELEASSDEPAGTASEGPVDVGDPRFFDGLDGLLASSPLVRATSDPRRVTGIDPDQIELASRGTDYLRSLATDETVLLPSRVQLLLDGPDPLQTARRWAADLGIPVVARLDRDGMHVFASGRHWQLLDPDVVVLETTGAGDSSAAAIVAALAAGNDLLRAARFGMAVARLALSRWGHEGLAGDPLSEPFPEINTREVTE